MEHGRAKTAEPAHKPISVIELAGAGPLPSAGQAFEWLDRTAKAVGRGGQPPSVVVWRVERALVVTKRETRHPNFARAASQMTSTGWPVSVRGSGGGVCAVGPGTVQIALVFPRPRDGVTLDSVYDVLATLVLTSISRFDVIAEVAPVPASYCSGRYDIAVGSRKIAGLAQQWRGPAGRGGYVMAAASVIVDEDPTELASAINSFASLRDRSERCRPSAITSLAREVGESGNVTGLTSRFSSCLRECAHAASFECFARLGE